MDELLEKYYGMFGDIFPTMCFMCDSHEELIEKIENCIKNRLDAETLYDLSYEKELY